MVDIVECYEYLRSRQQLPASAPCPYPDGASAPSTTGAVWGTPTRDLLHHQARTHAARAMQQLRGKVGCLFSAEGSCQKNMSYFIVHQKLPA